MAKKLTLSARARSGAAKMLRRQDQLPAVLYGHGESSRALSLDRKAFLKVFKESGHTALVSLALADDQGNGNSDHPVLVKEVQLHPVNGALLHVDLYQVRMDEKIHAEVPLLFVGTPPAVKNLGGVLVRGMDEVEVEALPPDLPHDIEVDVSRLTGFDEPIRVSDLTVSDKVTILADPDSVVAIVQAPRSEEELEADLAQEVKEDVSQVEGVADKPAEGEEAEKADDAAEEKPAE